MRVRATTTFARLLAVTALAAALGCGGDDAPPDAAPTTTTTEAPAPTTEAPTTTTEPPGEVSTCDVETMLAHADRTIELARLAAGGEWSTDTDGVAFDERTNDAEEFRDRLALDCGLRAVQRTDAGAERLLLAAWTGERRAYVVQATDGPATPYAPDQIVELLFEQPRGEWLVNQFVWAGTLSGSETVVVATDDYSWGHTAKAWQALPRWENIPATIDTERHAIDVLERAGARNISPAEPVSVGSEIAQIQFVTPLGLHLIALIAPTDDWYGPDLELFEGEQEVVEIGGVDVYLTRGAPEAYAVASVSWICDDNVWLIDSVWGTVDELVAWTETLIATQGCTPG